MMNVLLSDLNLEVASHVGINFLNYLRNFSIQTFALFIRCQQHYHSSMSRWILGLRANYTMCS